MKPLLLCLCLTASPALAQSDSTLTVSAAASLKNVLSVLGRDFEKANANTQIRFNFAGSGTLRAQIEQGAPVDVFLSADDANMNALVKQGLVEASTRRVAANNRLVLVVPFDSRLNVRSFRDVARPQVKLVAIGAPSVPAGARAQEVFSRLGIWAAVRAKAVRGRDVREVLTQVEAGNVAAGVVYQSDAASSRRVRVVAMAPRSMHAPIRYPAAVVSNSRNKALARRFLAFLGSKRAQSVFRQAHFVTR